MLSLQSFPLFPYLTNKKIDHTLFIIDIFILTLKLLKNNSVLLTIRKLEQNNEAIQKFPYPFIAPTYHIGL